MDLGADLFNRMHLVPRVQAVQEKRTNRPTNAKSHVPTRRDTARHNVTNASPSPPAAAPCVTPRRNVSDASFGKVMCSLCNTPHWRTTPGDRCSKCTERVTTCGICLDSCLVFNDYCSWTGTRHHTGGCNGRNLCTSCMVQHCSVELERSDGMTCRCPHPECAATLTNDELRLVSNGLAERVELVQTRIKRAKELTDKQAKLNELADRLAEREGLLEWASLGVAQICPHCSDVVERSGGCRHMTCKCGGGFCFVCGGDWPCDKAACEVHGAKPRLAVLDLVHERRAQRRFAFLMAGGCGDECAASCLPPEMLRLIAEKIC